MKAEILKYLTTQTRNKVVFHSTPLEGVSSHNFGVLLAESIITLIDDKRLSLKVSLHIDELLNNCKETHEEYGEIIAIKNIGILFEPDLRLDINHLIRKHSDTCTLFIQWEGVIEKNHIYFLTKESGKKLEIENLSHISI